MDYRSLDQKFEKALYWMPEFEKRGIVIRSLITVLLILTLSISSLFVVFQKYNIGLASLISGEVLTLKNTQSLLSKSPIPPAEEKGLTPLKRSKNEKINVVVPTGNFGDILAGYYAKKMGVPINKLICASNENNVLYDFINTGVYNRKRELKATLSPSMDILVSSNLERLLYELCSHDVSVINSMVGSLNKKGEFTITRDMKEKLLEDFYGEFATDDQTLKTIKDIYDKYGYLIDTHTAVACSVYKKYVEDTKDNLKTVIISTASPFKFPNSVMKAINKKFTSYDDFDLLDKVAELSNCDIPKSLKDISKRRILHRMVCKKENMGSTIFKILKI